VPGELAWKTQKNLSGQLVSGPRREPAASRIRSSSTNHSVATFGSYQVRTGFIDHSLTLWKIHLEPEHGSSPPSSKVKKDVPLPPCRLQGESSYSSCSFLTSAIDGVSGQSHAPAALPPPPRMETLVDSWLQDGWASELVWTHLVPTSKRVEPCVYTHYMPYTQFYL
jgi:hypothetical protein